MDITVKKINVTNVVILVKNVMDLIVIIVQNVTTEHT